MLIFKKITEIVKTASLCQLLNIKCNIPYQVKEVKKMWFDDFEDIGKKHTLRFLVFASAFICFILLISNNSKGGTWNMETVDYNDDAAIYG